MELKLNIYNGKKIEKTYTSRDFDLRTGTCEDILKLVDIDKFSGGIGDEEAMMEVLKVVVKAFGKFKTLMQEIFEGLTDEEYSNTTIKEVAGVVLKVIMFTISELFNIANEKN